MTSTERLDVTALRGLFLFEHLDGEQLDWVLERHDVAAYPAGTEVATEGQPAEWFLVLLSGTLSMHRQVRGDEIETVRTDHVGAYSGAVQFYLGEQVEQTYPVSVRAVTDCRFLRLPAGEFAAAFTRWFPMAVHLLQGVFLGMRNNDELVGQRERLMALGKLSAGLMHELNNPAAAVSRATDTLGDRLAGMRHELALIADGGLDSHALQTLTSAQERIVEQAQQPPTLSTLAATDREDELADWLEAHEVTDAGELAAAFATAGVDTDTLTGIRDTVPDGDLTAALLWLADTVETETLLAEVRDASARISALVGAAREYSQPDRGGQAPVELRPGLESTLVMLTRKIGDHVDVVRDYDDTLPAVPAYAAELNQVWTNLIDNAVDAMSGSGTLTVRTTRDGDHALVEIIDTGPGVPDELRHQVFEPFFSTKPTGSGTGLGLDLSRRIVVNRHGGELRVTSAPGDTRFQTRLPLSPARSEGESS